MDVYNQRKYLDSKSNSNKFILLWYRVVKGQVPNLARLSSNIVLATFFICWITLFIYIYIYIYTHIRVPFITQCSIIMLKIMNT